MDSGSKKNILMIITNFGFGGAEKSFSKLANLLSESHDVTICVFNKQSYTNFSYSHNANVISLDVAAGKGLMGKILNFWKRVNKLNLIKRKYNVDISISFLEGADYINILSKGRCKKIICIRGALLEDLESKKIKGFIRKWLLIRWLYPRADCIVTVNKGISDRFTQFLKINEKPLITEIDNFYDFERLEKEATQEIECELGRIFVNPVIITCGRLSKEKGLDYLIQSFSMIKKKIDNVKLVLVGSGAYKQYLIEICGKYNLPYSELENLNPNDDVFFLGYQRFPLKFVKRSSVFVLPSLNEGFPNALMESMVTGTLVVAADCPYGPRYILKGDEKESYLSFSKKELTDYGLLMPMINKENMVEFWASAITDVIINHRNYDLICENAKKRVKSFTKIHASQDWLNLIEKL